MLSIVDNIKNILCVEHTLPCYSKIIQDKIYIPAEYILCTYAHQEHLRSLIVKMTWYRNSFIPSAIQMMY